MSKHTTISWTHATFNPWWGCVKVSPACDHCYAEAWAKRTGFADLWNPESGMRRFFGDKHWREPICWNRDAEKEGGRRRVFCASMADVFDNHPAVEPHRARLWDVIRSTPWLDWLLLTKRIGNAVSMLPNDWGSGYRNVWLGATIANQEEADRDVPKLLRLPACVRFLSCEPLLGPVNLGRIMLKPSSAPERGAPPVTFDALYGWHGGAARPFRINIDWVITGGESGGKARVTHPDWVRSLRDQCAAAGVAFHHKQNGEWIEVDGDDPVREVEVGSAEARSIYQRGDRFITKAGSVYASPDALPVGVPARLMRRVGKLVAGRTLDGRIWDEFPRSAT